jgi:hypothetical protein
LTTPTADFGDFWTGFRENLGRGAVMSLLNVVIIVINVTNLEAYRFQAGAGIDLLRVIWLLTLVIWFGTQFYMWPLFYRMEQPTLRGAMRNAVVMIVLNPGRIYVGRVGGHRLARYLEHCPVSSMATANRWNIGGSCQ